MLIYVPKETAVIPRDGECLVNHWWIIHPEQGLAFYIPTLRAQTDPMPQCNKSEEVTRTLAERVYSNHAVEQIPIVYASHAIAVRHALQRAATGA